MKEKNKEFKKKKLSLSRLQQILAEIPKGQIITYKELAKKMGNEKAIRAVASLCGKNPEPNKFPCFKVVKSDGFVGNYIFGVEEKIKRLELDGIKVENGKVVDFLK